MHVAGERPLGPLTPANHAARDVAAAELRRRRALWWAWTRTCALGETLGPVLAGLAALVLASAGDEPTAARVVVVALDVGMCVVAGALVAWFQWRALAPKFPDVSMRAWSTATIAAAASTVAAVRVAATLGTSSPRSTGPFVLAGATVACGAAAGALVGFAQWLVLRRGARRAGRWIADNALAWGAAGPVMLTATRLSGAFAPPAAVAIALVGALAAGLLVGAVTGRAFVRIPPRLHLVRGGVRPHQRHAPQQSSG